MRRSHRTGSRARIAGIGLLALTLAGIAGCARVAPAPVVSFYGDSLGAQSQPYVAAGLAAGPTRVTFRPSTFPGLALCDFSARVLDEITARRAAVVVLEFSGNNLTPCMRDGSGVPLAQSSPEFAMRYRLGIREIFQAGAANGTKVVWATTPPRLGSDVAERLAAIAREEAVGRPGVTVATTGAALTEDGVTYTPTLSCYPDEIGRGCGSDGRIVVRHDDGLHLADAYSPGGRRFGEAIAAAAIAALRS
jgi:hypothetical protein